jgi:tetratricopeptide (TPR) repeat protein
VKKPQWIVIVAAVLLVTVIYAFGRTVPNHRAAAPVATHSDSDGHDHGMAVANFSVDTMLNIAKKQLTAKQVLRLNELEYSISRGDVKAQQLKVYHQLAHFWSDSARIFEPYAWYEAEAARLENSEKTLTFAAHLFLENLQQDNDPVTVRWKALQAKDLFERSLKINPANDSSKVGLGACYLFGNISDAPMEGIQKIREVVERDSSNVFAQLTLAKGSILSGQYDKAVARLETVHRLDPGNIEAVLMMADMYERMGKKKEAASWYRESMKIINRTDARSEIQKRIEALEK